LIRPSFLLIRSLSAYFNLSYFSIQCVQGSGFTPDDKDKLIVKEFKNRINQNLRKHLDKIIIYGSRARNEENEYSDIDIAVIVDKKGTEIEQELEESAYQLMWKYDFKPLISLKIFSKSDFNQALRDGFSFYRNVEREGIIV